jgi:hypothetical protein
VNCRRVTLSGRDFIVCGHFHETPVCEVCGETGALLCDWILAKGTPYSPGRTCDRRICDKHAQQVGPDKHLCPEHQAAYAQWQAQRAQRQPEAAA